MEGHEVQNLGTVGEPGTQRGEVAASGTWRGNALTEAGRCGLGNPRSRSGTVASHILYKT